jgi:hypothetical protein
MTMTEHYSRSVRLDLMWAASEFFEEDVAGIEWLSDYPRDFIELTAEDQADLVRQLAQIPYEIEE